MSLFLVFAFFFWNAVVRVQLRDLLYMDQHNVTNTDIGCGIIVDHWSTISLRLSFWKFYASVMGQGVKDVDPNFSIIFTHGFI